MRKKWKGTPESRNREARLRWFKKGSGKLDKYKSVRRMLNKGITKKEY